MSRICSDAGRGLGVALVIAVISGAGCKKKSEPAPAAPKRRADVRIAATGDVSRYTPLREHLAAAIGATVDVVRVADESAAVQALIAAEADLAWLGAMSHVRARLSTNVSPLATGASDRDTRSVFVASPSIESLAAIRGKRFSFGPKRSATGHLIPLHYLMLEYQLDPEKDLAGPPRFASSPEAVVRAVVAGDVAAGVLPLAVWRRLVRKKKIDPAKIAPLWTTPAFVGAVWTVRARLADKLRARLGDALLALDGTSPKHAAVLRPLGATSLVLSAPPDFDPLEQVARGAGAFK